MNDTSYEHDMVELSLCIDRIKEMEKLYDKVQEYWNANILDLTDPDHKHALSQLVRYFESPAWLSDYDADENGEFPKDLKRGVLSQDGLSNLLSAIFPEGSPPWVYEESHYDC